MPRQFRHSRPSRSIARCPAFAQPPQLGQKIDDLEIFPGVAPRIFRELRVVVSTQGVGKTSETRCR